MFFIAWTGLRFNRFDLVELVRCDLKCHLKGSRRKRGFVLFNVRDDA